MNIVVTKYNSDVEYRLQVILRSRVRLAIKNNQKSGSAIGDLGCSIKDLKGHLESLFVSNMSWDNYGGVAHRSYYSTFLF